MVDCLCIGVNMQETTNPSIRSELRVRDRPTRQQVKKDDSSKVACHRPKDLKSGSSNFPTPKHLCDNLLRDRCAFICVLVQGGPQKGKIGRAESMDRWVHWQASNKALTPNLQGRKKKRDRRIDVQGMQKQD